MPRTNARTNLMSAAAFSARDRNRLLAPLVALSPACASEVGTSVDLTTQAQVFAAQTLDDRNPLVVTLPDGTTATVEITASNSYAPIYYDGECRVPCTEQEYFWNEYWRTERVADFGIKIVNDTVDTISVNYHARLNCLYAEDFGSWQLVYAAVEGDEFTMGVVVVPPGSEHHVDLRCVEGRVMPPTARVDSGGAWQTSPPYVHATVYNDW